MLSQILYCNLQTGYYIPVRGKKYIVYLYVAKSISVNKTEVRSLSIKPMQ